MQLSTESPSAVLLLPSVQLEFSPVARPSWSDPGFYPRLTEVQPLAECPSPVLLLPSVQVELPLVAHPSRWNRHCGQCGGSLDVWHVVDQRHGAGGSDGHKHGGADCSVHCCCRGGGERGGSAQTKTGGGWGT